MTQTTTVDLQQLAKEHLGFREQGRPLDDQSVCVRRVPTPRRT
jgi:hypothetical protein